MRTTALITAGTAAVIVASAAFKGPLIAQETKPKPVPKDSVRLSIPGCPRGRIFTASRRTLDEPGSFDIPEGMHLRMNGPKKMLAEIEAHQGSMIEITGLMKKGQYKPDGVTIGGDVRIAPGPAPMAGGPSSALAPNQIFIDVEGWRPIVGECRTR
jgi:hypothetical protein